MFSADHFAPGSCLCLRAGFFFQLTLAAMLLPAAAQAQVTYTGTAANQNFGSEAIGSTSAASTFSFSIAAGTTVGSIGVVTTGIADLDFAEATGSTCAAQAYATASTCTVNVTFAPIAPGLRQGAVIFFSEAGNTGTVLGSVMIYGIGTGPQIAFNPSTEIVTGSGSPYGVAVDAAGDLFISSGNQVEEVPAGGGSPTAIDPTVNGEGLSSPWGLALDGAGDLFIADFAHSRVVEVPAGGGLATAIDPVVNGAGLILPAGLAFDGAGDLFIADYHQSRVVEVPAGGGAPIAISPVVNGVGLNYTSGVAVDGAGDLFIADSFNDRVVEVPAGGGSATAIDPTVNGEGLDFPTGLAVDGLGDLFITDRAHERVVEVPAGGGAATSLALNGLTLSDPFFVALDGAGDLFIADQANSRVVELQRSQPPALNFPTTTFVGSTDTKDGKKTVQVWNVGNEPLTLTALSYPADFFEPSGDESACTSSTSLSAGQECDVPVEFKPENVGVLSESVTLTDNTMNVAGSKQSIAVSGTGMSPTVATHFLVTTTASVVAGTPFGITITAIDGVNGTATTYDGTVSFTSSDPDFVNPGPLTLSNGVGKVTVTLETFGTQTITVTDTTTSSLTGSASFAVASAPPPPPPVTYTGTSANQNFGSQAVGSTSAARTFSFSVATGTTVGSIGAVVLGSPNLDFAIATGSNCAVQDYTSPATCTVNVTFTPKVPGLRMGSLAFFSGANETGTVLGGALLYGIGTGPELAYGYNGMVLAEGSPGVPGVFSPWGWPTDPGALAVDGAGDVFVADQFCLRELPAGGGNVGCVGPGGVVALALDGAGRLYQVDSGNNFVNGPNGPIAPVADGEVLNGPAGLALDGEGDLFIADSGNNRLVEVPAGGGAATAIAPTVNGKGLNSPQGIAVDGAGDLFIMDTNNSRVVEVPAGGGAATAIGVGGFALAVDAAGDLFVADSVITEVPAGGGAPFTFVNGDDVVASVDNAGGVAVDGAGNVFASFDDFYFWPYDTPISFLYEAQASEQAPTLNFPTLTNVGSIDTTDGTQTVQVLNVGNQALNLAALSYPADFPQASGDLNPCPVSISLSAGQSCDIPIEFAPKQVGALSENVTFTENSLNATGTKQSIALSGTATASKTNTPASITSPTLSSTLTGPSVTFTWTNTGATLYYLSVGSTGVGSTNVFNSGWRAATSWTATGLPTNGEALYVRLSTDYSGTVVHNDYTYTASTQAAITTPTAGSTLAGPTQTFNWSAATGANLYYLSIGSTGVGSNNLFNTGWRDANSWTATGLPANGEALYVRITTDYNGIAVHNDYTYTAATQATLTTPSPGTTLSGSAVTFDWNPGSAGATLYYLSIGSTGVGSSNLFNSGWRNETSQAVTGLPANGETLYVRLSTDFGGATAYTDYTYTAH